MNPRTTPVWRTLALAALLGALCTLGFAPFAVSPAPTFSLAGLLLLWQRATTPRQAALLGLAWGIGCFLTGVSWVYISLSEFGGMAMPLAVLATFLLCLLLALFPALAGGLCARWRSSTTRDIWLFAGLWTLSEWLRGTVLTGFPWLAIGYSQSPPSPLAGWGAVLGVYGVGFSVALIGGLITSLFAKGWKKALSRHGLKPWLAIILLLGGGALLRQMDWTQPVGAPLKVALLQGNVPQSLKWDPQNLALSIDTYLQLVREHPADLVVMPETALPLFFNEVPRDVLRGLTRHGTALFGIAIRTTDGGYANGAVLLGPTFSATGQPGAYTKRHLVPFGEYAPPGFAWVFQLVNIPMSGFTPGPARQAPLIFGGQKIAPNICYEDLFGEELLTALPQATLLVNLSNTAWFGDSLAQPQHLQIAQMRAIETGRTMLRATNTGMTAMIAPNGIVAAALPPFTAAALTVAAQGYSGLTPYARWGNALILLLAALACLPALRRRAK
jgi:apolipoprotein N-acyltransferase